MRSIENHDLSKPLVLTSKQRDVLEALQSKQTEKFPLRDWYIGALYALSNHYNPDRVAQAAHSLRELLQKLPRVVQGNEVHVSATDFAGMRRNINDRILKDKERYLEGWKNKVIDGRLDKTLRKAEGYFSRNQQPTRKEQIKQAVATIDPMVNSLGSEIQKVKRNQYHHLWNQLEEFSHHGSGPDVAKFNNCLEELENILFDLLAPVTAEDQKGIQTILSLPDKSDSDIEDMFSLIERRGANFVFFFRQVSENADVTWLPYLKKRGYFAHPPTAQRSDDDSVILPFWWPIHYLEKISNQAPDEVIELVEVLPPNNNALVYDSILDIVLQLPIEYSVTLKDKILEYAGMEHQFRAYRYAKLLERWTKENQTSAALELAKILVKFAPDPQSESKQKRRIENSPDSNTLLKPSPHMLPGEYRDIMLKGIRPIAESDPYKVVGILIDATANMIYLRRHKRDFNNEEDNSWSWCPCLYKPGKDGGSSEETLVHMLTFACEKVFEKSHDAMMDLDETLRDQHWKIFKRLRHHLYAKYLNEQTKPWILELILTPKYYNRWHHSYEFQLMIRRACEHFGETLLTKEERTQIFDAILAGPSKTDYRRKVVEFWGIEFNDEDFLQYKRHRHRIQLTPFAPVLLGKYETHLQELETEGTSRIFDEDYIPSKTEVREVRVSKRSPYSHQELAKLTDENLLNSINAWDDEDKFYENEDYVEINIEALANAFQTVFMESIIPDTNRLRFWIQNRRNIERPIYARMMIYAMQEHVMKKNFYQLNEWFMFCKWVLSHPDKLHEGDYRRGDESRETVNWFSSRRAVGDFIRTCLEKDVELPIVARGQLAKILETLCTQFDSDLDKNLNSIDPRIDPLAEGINSTRGRALEDLIKFGLWLRRYDSACAVPELTTILEKRFSQESRFPNLTLPEYAILGANYPRIINLNKTWAIKHKSDFFPQNALSEWVAAFVSFVGHSEPSTTTFKILQEDFYFALQHLSDFKNRNRFEKETIDILGEHLFDYYLWDLYSLEGDGSLLEQYYHRTDNSPEIWGNLFKYIGHRLSSSGKSLDQSLKEKIMKFCEWRLDQKNPTELRHFTFWLQAECLDAEWRLNAYSKVLDICEIEDWGFHLKTLCEMVQNHTAKVVECVWKLTERIEKDNFYIQAAEAKIILKSGRESSDEDVRDMTKRLLDNLLKSGRFVLPDLVD